MQRVLRISPAFLHRWPNSKAKPALGWWWYATQKQQDLIHYLYHCLISPSKISLYVLRKRLPSLSSLAIYPPFDLTSCPSLIADWLSCFAPEAIQSVTSTWIIFCPQHGIWSRVWQFTSLHYSIALKRIISSCSQTEYSTSPSTAKTLLKQIAESFFNNNPHTVKKPVK